MKNKYLKIATMYLLVEGIVMALVVLLVVLSSVMILLKNLEIPIGDPARFVPVSVLICIVFLAAGFMGLKQKAPKVRILLGACCAIYGIVRVVGAELDIATIIVNALSAVASVIYMYGAWKESGKE